MRRIERVYQQLLAVSQQNVSEGFEMMGADALAIAQQLDLTRANTSSELNKLVRAKRVVKIKDYPVRYIPVETIEAQYNIRWDENIEQLTADIELQAGRVDNKEDYTFTPNPFDTMIGSNDSLKKAVSQAKAAVHYPPNGLHMLLLGPTGSGKTFFANKIYRYAIFEKLLLEGASFESFNCADYYHNPQLLLSQLFGFQKGSFTGADQDQAGVVEKADGGILLLDEVHRLTPEGQEMLFYLIDKGKYNRLGESGFQRTANVLIICATTEEPQSALLGTFLRRIPMTIQIPALAQRSLSERVELTKFLFEQEAKRVQRIFYIDIDVIQALVEAVSYGNVGQLQATIQLICAQAFLHHLNEDQALKISVAQLPEEMVEQWQRASQSIKRSKELENLVDITTTIDPFKKENLMDTEDVREAFNIYTMIEQKVATLAKQSFTMEQINQYILTDLHLHVKHFVHGQSINYNLLKFVHPDISELTLVLKTIAEQELGRHFDRKFLYYVGMHIDAYLRRNKEARQLAAIDLPKLRLQYPKEYAVAIKFQSVIEQSLAITVPEIEIIYLTMLLVSIEDLEQVGSINVLVVTHGNATATSMVEVATELLGAAPIVALDMPLDISPEAMYSRIRDHLQQLDASKGVLMLVDMGSLVTLGTKLAAETGIVIKTIPNVTTAMVLDVVRKIHYLDLSITGIYASVVKDFLAVVQDQHHGRPKAILTICTTGSGTAKKLEAIVSEIIHLSTDQLIEVIPVSSLQLDNTLAELVESHQIIASVGVKDPKINAPFIALEYLIEGSGEQLLRQLVGLPYQATTPLQKSSVIQSLCLDTLTRHLVYLNPYHVTELLLEWMAEVQLKLQRNLSNTDILKTVVHTAFALERVVKQCPMTYHDQPNFAVLQHLAIVTETIQSIEAQLKLTLTRDEKLFIAESLIQS